MVEHIGLDKVKTLAEKKGLKPARVKGTDGISLTKGNTRMDIITWDDFTASLKRRGLAVYESGGWMKRRSVLPFLHLLATKDRNSFEGSEFDVEEAPRGLFLRTSIPS